LVSLLLLLPVSEASADATTVVTLGEDLTQEQRLQVLDAFDVDQDQVPILTVTNEEEYRYLDDVASPAEIGTRAISCAYVELQQAGSGLLVETQNITWVTPQMYASAASTGGVRDARIIAAAPFPVSGTAALAGIFKAFEHVSGDRISTSAKETAHKELYLLSLLGRETGEQEQVTLLVQDAKERVAGTAMDRKQILGLVEELARERGVKLTEAQKQQLVDLLERIKGLDLSPQTLRAQLNNYITENPGFFRRLIDFILSLLDTLIDFFRTGGLTASLVYKYNVAKFICLKVMTGF